jgi:hypothetical protein
MYVRTGTGYWVRVDTDGCKTACCICAYPADPQLDPVNLTRPFASVDAAMEGWKNGFEILADEKPSAIATSLVEHGKAQVIPANSSALA